eukprot:5505848-Alexandrium_andersonii.AAC.1
MRAVRNRTARAASTSALVSVCKVPNGSDKAARMRTSMPTENNRHQRGEPPHVDGKPSMDGNAGTHKGSARHHQTA